MDQCRGHSSRNPAMQPTLSKGDIQPSVPTDLVGFGFDTIEEQNEAARAWQSLLPTFGPLTADADLNAITWAAEAANTGLELPTGNGSLDGSAPSLPVVASASSNSTPLSKMASALSGIGNYLGSSLHGAMWPQHMTQQVVREQVAPGRAAKRKRKECSVNETCGGGGAGPSGLSLDTGAPLDASDACDDSDLLVFHPTRHLPNTQASPEFSGQEDIATLLEQNLLPPKKPHPEMQEEKQAKKKVKNERKAKEIRQAVDADSFKNRKGNWRKYGQKRLEGNRIRSYYRCNFPGCPVKRQIVSTEDTGKVCFAGMRTKGEHVHEALDHPVSNESMEMALMDMGIVRNKGDTNESVARSGGAESLHAQGSLKEVVLKKEGEVVDAKKAELETDTLSPAAFMAVATANEAMEQANDTVLGNLPLPSLDATFLSKVGMAPPSFMISDPRAEGLPVVFVSPGVPLLTGYRPEELLGQELLGQGILQGKDTDPGTVQKIREAVNQQKEIRTVILHYKKNGDKFLNLLHITPVKDNNGVAIALVGMQTDVTRWAKKE